MTDQLKACRADLQRAIDHVHVVITSSHLPGWKGNREAWEVVLCALNVRAQAEDGEDARTVNDDVRDLGTGITVDGKRVCPTRVVIHRKGAAYMDDARDAARYRWLRRSDTDVFVVWPMDDDAWVPHTEELDACVDKALSAQRGEVQS